MGWDGGVTTRATGKVELNFLGAPEMLLFIQASVGIMPDANIQSGTAAMPSQLVWKSRAAVKGFFAAALSPAGLPFIARMYQKLMALRRVYGQAGGGWLLVPANMTAAAGGLPHATHWAIWLPIRFPGVVVWRDLWSKQ